MAIKKMLKIKLTNIEIKETVLPVIKKKVELKTSLTDKMGFKIILRIKVVDSLSPIKSLRVV